MAVDFSFPTGKVAQSAGWVPSFMSSQSTVIGVDVGTGSARAGLFDLAGRRIAVASCPIQMWQPKPEWAEQSSEGIWRAVCQVVREVALAAPDAARIVGVGFDATCSLVVLDSSDAPVAVSDSGDDERNVIVWMDHRALAETDEINAGGHDAVLKYVGGKISPEMETPKLMWLKRHQPGSWARAGKFLDLADFLTYRATGSDHRSLCTTVCKWTYLGHEGRWDEDYFRAIGIEDALISGKIGASVRPVGEPVGQLTAQAAEELGLPKSVVVSIGMIDAHAGGLGVLGAVWEGEPEGVEPDAVKLESALALIAGTSSCHMAVAKSEHFVPGVWGPYWSAMVPEMWLAEGGQSAAGALLDYTLLNHAQTPRLLEIAEEQGRPMAAVINDVVDAMAADEGVAHRALLTRDLHVFDGHLGNRSPIADPRARGMVDGLQMDTSMESLARLYLATVQSIAYGTRAIIDAMNASGYSISRLYAVGGLTKNPLWLQETADSVGVAIILPEEPEAVLLGSAILGAVAAGAYSSVPRAMRAMCRSAATIEPNPEVAEYHRAKYAIYKELYDQQLARRQAMSRFSVTPTK